MVNYNEELWSGRQHLGPGARHGIKCIQSDPGSEFLQKSPGRAGGSGTGGWCRTLEVSGFDFYPAGKTSDSDHCIVYHRTVLERVLPGNGTEYKTVQLSAANVYSAAGC